MRYFEPGFSYQSPCRLAPAPTNDENGFGPMSGFAVLGMRGRYRPREQQKGVSMSAKDVSGPQPEPSGYRDVRVSWVDRDRVEGS